MNPINQYLLAYGLRDLRTKNKKYVKNNEESETEIFITIIGKNKSRIFSLIIYIYIYYFINFGIQNTILKSHKKSEAREIGN